MPSDPLPAAPETPASVSTVPALPVPLYRVLLVACLALTAGSAATLWVAKSRYEKFPGYLQARVRSVSALRDARISRILTKPGDMVAAGQPLVILEDSSFEQQLREKRHDVTALEIELVRTRAALEVELDLQQRDIRDRIFETRYRSTQVMRRQILAGRELPFASTSDADDRMLPLVPRSGRSAPLFEEAPTIVRTGGDSSEPPSPPSLMKVSLVEMELCTQHIRELESMSRELPDKVGRSMGIDLVEARLAYAQAELAALEARNKELTLVAESSGLVGVFQKQVGDHVVPHEPIVQILDEEQPYLVLQFPSPRISDFAPGTVVDLRFPNGRKGKGRVEEIPPQTSALPEQPGSTSDTIITAHVDPVGALWPQLPFGSVVEVRRRK